MTRSAAPPIRTSAPMVSMGPVNCPTILSCVPDGDEIACLPRWYCSVALFGSRRFTMAVSYGFSAFEDCQLMVSHIRCLGAVDTG